MVTEAAIGIEFGITKRAVKEGKNFVIADMEAEAFVLIKKISVG